MFCILAADNGTMHFWDWKTGYNFQRIQAAVQPGSIDSEAGIFACTYDNSGSRLVTCEADKTIKIYKEDDSAVSVNCSSCALKADWIAICCLTNQILAVKSSFIGLLYDFFTIQFVRFLMR